MLHVTVTTATNVCVSACTCDTLVRGQEMADAMTPDKSVMGADERNSVISKIAKAGWGCCRGRAGRGGGQVKPWVEAGEGQAERGLFVLGAAGRS